MDNYGFISAIALFFYTFLILTFLASKKNEIIKYFLLLLLAMIGWTGGSVMMRQQVYPSYIFWYHISLAGLMYMPNAYFCFLNAFGAKEKTSFGKLYFLITTVMIFANIPSGLFARWPEQIISEQQLRYQYSFDWKIVFLFAVAAVILLHTFYNVLKICKEKPQYKKQFEPVIAGVMGVFLGNLALTMPLFSGFPIDIVAGIINAILLLYALIRRSLFQVRLLASESVCYGVGLVITFALFFNLSRYLPDWITMVHPGGMTYYTMIFSVLFVLTVLFVSYLWRSLAKNVFIKDELQQSEMLKMYSGAVSKSLNVKDILEKTIDVIQQAAKVGTIYICIRDDSSGDFVTQYSDKPLSDLSFVIKKDNPLAHIMEQYDGISLKEFRSMVEYKSMWEKEKQQLSELNVEACIALKENEELGGLILLSNHPGRRTLSYNDIQLLLSISSVASIAIKNARLYEQAYYEARTDELTGLLNRKYFYEVMEQEFEKNKDGSLVLAIINVDDFKLYNQLYGMKMGDLALQRIAQLIRNSVGDNGLVARYSGKEFAVIMPRYDVLSAKALISSIQKQIFQMSDESVDYKLKVLTVSVGISAAPYAAKSVNELIENADMAVYHVKHNGKNGIQIFDMVLQGVGEPMQSKEHAVIYQSYESTIFALTAAIDAKDHYTFRHSSNVAYYATSLARKLELNEDVIECIRQAALLHDVGKIGIPETVLNKPEKLNSEEYEVIKGHVEASIGIIRHLPSLDYVIPAVIGHHERYDGTGYPRRIAGEDIPLSARILCIADSFDAMTSSRCYKKGVSLKRSLEIIEQEAGKQFDPELVPVFAASVRAGEIELVEPEDILRDKKDEKC